MPILNHFNLDQNGTPSPQAQILLGALIEIEVHVPIAVAKQLSANNQPIPTPVTGTALIDTGATFTAFDDPILSQKLNLNPVNQITTGTANGPVIQNRYGVSLQFPTFGANTPLLQVVGVNLTG